MGDEALEGAAASEQQGSSTPSFLSCSGELWRPTACLHKYWPRVCFVSICSLVTQDKDRPRPTGPKHPAASCPEPQAGRLPGFFIVLITTPFYIFSDCGQNYNLVLVSCSSLFD
uniref:Uncharacterized protein n=1 Tax=Xiphophorus couchianus TaxID=32473 RepID=A0A3B5MSW9_9TELE